MPQNVSRANVVRKKKKKTFYIFTFLNFKKLSLSYLNCKQKLEENKNLMFAINKRVFLKLYGKSYKFI